MNTVFSILRIAALVALTGCASYVVHSDMVGQSRATLIKQMGAPEREYSSQGLQKLHYNQGFGSSHTYFFYLDINDRVVRWEQVRTEERFDTVRPGMQKAEIIDLLGSPTVAHSLARDRGYVWHYRYETPFCKSFVIEFSNNDEVRSAGYRIRSGRTCKHVGIG